MTINSTNIGTSGSTFSIARKRSELQRPFRFHVFGRRETVFQLRHVQFPPCTRIHRAPRGLPLTLRPCPGPGSRCWRRCVRRTTGASPSTSCTRPSALTRGSCSSIRSPSPPSPRSIPTCESIRTQTNASLWAFCGISYQFQKMSFQCDCQGGSGESLHLSHSKCIIVNICIITVYFCSIYGWPDEGWRGDGWMME